MMVIPITQKLDQYIMDALYCDPQRGCKPQTGGEPFLKSKDHLLTEKERKVPTTILYPTQGSKGTQYPALLFLPAAGPHDRKMGTKFGQCMNQAGSFVVASYDRLGTGEPAWRRQDRTMTKKEKFPQDRYAEEANVPWDDFLKEAQVILRALADDVEINSTQIFVVGHGEGALHALRLAQIEQNIPLAGLILLACPARDLWKLDIWNVKRWAGALAKEYPGKVDPSYIMALEQHGLNTILHGYADNNTRLQLRRQMEQAFAYLPPRLQSRLLAYQEARDSAFGMGNLYRDLLTFQPTQALKKAKQPVLVIAGDKDLEVDIDLDSRLIVQEAREAGKEGVELCILQDTDHFFKEQITPLPALQETFSSLDQALQNYITGKPNEQLIPHIARWLSKTMASARQSRTK